MIEYVEVQLSVWGKWVVRQASKGLGFGSVSPMFRDYRSGGGYSSRVPFGVEDYVCETNDAVHMCPKDLQAVAFQVYVKGGRRGEVAGRMGITDRTLRNRVHALHVAVMDRLHELEIERQDAKEEFKDRVRKKVDMDSAFQ